MSRNLKATRGAAVVAVIAAAAVWSGCGSDSDTGSTTDSVRSQIERGVEEATQGLEEGRKEAEKGIEKGRQRAEEGIENGKDQAKAGIEEAKRYAEEQVP